MSDWTIFGERLSHIMREYDVSLRELSRRTGITLTTLHRYATSKRVPRATEILKCANALGITIDYLLGLSNDPHLTGKGERIIGKGESMNDLISRQAAIDALHMHLMYRMGTDSNKKRLDDWINSLPSAQPEIIHCGDCKYFELDHFEKVDKFPIPIIVAHEICMKWSGGCRTSVDGWCFMAERRTDETD